MKNIEREIRSNVELRALDGDIRTIHGFIPYNSNSEGLPWIERLAKGCFTKTLQESRDILALYDHASGNLLGRTSNGSLRFNDTESGLEFDVDLPDTQLGRDTYEMCKSGLLSTCSFGFTAVRDEWSYENNEDIRVILEARLYEVSIVALAAYPTTHVSARSLSSIYEGKELNEDDQKSVQAEIEKLSALLPKKEEERQEPEPTGPTQEEIDAVAKSFEEIGDLLKGLE